MVIQQEACEKIMKLPEDGIWLILVMVDEVARQHGISTETKFLFCTIQTGSGRKRPGGLLPILSTVGWHINIWSVIKGLPENSCMTAYHYLTDKTHFPTAPFLEDVLSSPDIFSPFFWPLPVRQSLPGIFPRSSPRSRPYTDPRQRYFHWTGSPSADP